MRRLGYILLGLMAVLALTAHPHIKRRLALTWGVESDLTDMLEATDEMIKVGMDRAQSCDLAAPGETVVIIAGTPPYGQSGRTNTLKVERIPQPTPTDEDSGD